MLFFYEKFSWFDFHFEDVMWYFNHGKLLRRKTSNETKHLMEIPIFKLPHHHFYRLDPKLCFEMHKKEYSTNW